MLHSHRGDHHASCSIGPAPQRFHWAVGALAGLALAPAAFAQAPAYPSKPITIVVGYPPGGSTDLMGRMVGTELSNRLGQPGD